MNKKTTKAAIYVTADEAVARLLNLQMLPTAISLLEMTSAFQEQAGSGVMKIPDEKKPDARDMALLRKHMICYHRHELAEALLQGIRAELQEAKPRILTKSRSVVTALDWESVKAWAYDEFEISVAVEKDAIAEYEVEGDHPKYSEKLRGLIGPKGYSQLKTANLLASFYVLLFEFAKQRPVDYLKHNNQVVIDELAKELSLRSAKNHPYFESYAQSQASWKLQIQTANEVLTSAEEFVPPKR